MEKFAYLAGAARALEQLGLNELDDAVKLGTSAKGNFRATNQEELGEYLRNAYRNDPTPDKPPEPLAGQGLRPTTNTTKLGFSEAYRQAAMQGKALEFLAQQRAQEPPNPTPVYLRGDENDPHSLMLYGNRLIYGGDAQLSTLVPEAAALLRRAYAQQNKTALYTQWSKEEPPLRNIGTEDQGAGLAGTNPPRAVEPSSTASPSQPTQPPPLLGQLRPGVDAAGGGRNRRG